MSTIKEETLLRTNSLYIESCPNIDGWGFLNKVYDTQLNNQVEIKYNSAVHSQEWNEVKTTYPVFGQYENNKDIVIMIWEKRPNHLEFAESINTIITDYPQIVPIIVQYPQIVPIIIEHFMLPEIIVEWSQVVNSLVDTGKRNWLVGDGNAWINIGYKQKTESFRLQSITRSNQYNTTYYTYSTSGSYNNNARSPMLYFATSPLYIGVGKNDYRTNVNSISGESIVADISANNNIVTGLINGTEINIPFEGSLITNVDEHIYGINEQGSHRYNSRMDVALYKKWDGNELVYWLVPFTRNGRIGLLDIVSNEMLYNVGAGQFTIVTEDK